MTDKHTKGPWRIARDDRPGMEWNNHIVYGDSTHTICFMAHKDEEDDNSEFEANAHLIAAAPEMLKELKILLDTFKGYQGMEFTILKSIIAKAKGELNVQERVENDKGIHK